MKYWHAAGVALGLCLGVATGEAQDWAGMATVSTTMGAKAGRLCVGEGFTTDARLGCPMYAPSLTTAGDVSVSGSLSAQQFIGDGSLLTGIGEGGVSLLVSLSDVSITSPVNRSVLQYVNSVGQWMSVPISQAMSTTSMISGWPDAIVCHSGGNPRIVYFHGNNGSEVTYHAPGSGSGGWVNVQFNTNGTYNTNSSMSGYDCLSKSISTLYAEGKAFNLVGNADVGGGSALGDRITSGTLGMVANSTTSVVSLSTGGTTWGYLSNVMSYLPRINAERVSASLVSSTYIQISSATDVLACDASRGGTLRYISATLQFCDGSMWATLGTTSIDYMIATSGAATDVTANTTVLINSVNVSNGSSISLNPATGRFTLQGGRTYRLMGKLRLNNTSPTGGANYTWRNVTAGANIGAYGAIQTNHASSGWSDSEMAMAIVAPTSTIEVELRWGSSVTTGTDLSEAQVMVEAISTHTGGGGATSDTLSLLNCTVGQVPVWDDAGNVWQCGAGGGGGLGDRITSGTLAMVANSDTSVVSLSTGGTTWGYLSNVMSYLPRINAERVSSSLVSSTHVQLSSATDVLACSASLTGTMRYSSGTVQVCTGVDWDHVGNAGLGIPTGSIMAFATSSCPAGWVEYTPSRGRFLRGIDNGAGIDPEGTRSPGSVQNYLIGEHTHEVPGLKADAGSYPISINVGAWPHGGTGNTYSGRRSGGSDHAAASGLSAWAGPVSNPISESRPANVAVTFCQYTGVGGGGGGGGGVMLLASLTDVSTAGAAPGNVLAYDGSMWVVSSVTPGSTAQDDRIISGTLAMIANENSNSVSLSTAGTTWGYLSSGMSYLPRINTERVSSSLVSSTHVQLSSATDVLACSASLTGTMRYSSGTVQVCTGVDWDHVGNAGLGIPTGSIMAFATSSCPAGWVEYTPSRGRFLRGIDTLAAGIDPSGTRMPGSLQDDALQEHSHSSYYRQAFEIGGTANALRGTQSESNSGMRDVGPVSLGNAANETRPKNVAVTFCQYTGVGGGGGGGGGVMFLASLTDVSTAGAAPGNVLAYDGSMWVVSSVAAGFGSHVSATTISGSLIQVGHGNGAACDAARRGAIRYSDVSSSIQYCNSTAWVSVGPSDTTVPSFAAVNSGAQAVASAVLVSVTLSVENFDTNNNFASSRFTVTVPGTYVLTGAIRYTNTATPYRVYAMIYKNGVNVSTIQVHTTNNSGQFTHVPITVVDRASAGDSYELVAQQISGGSVNLPDGGNYFAGSLISMAGGSGGGASVLDDLTNVNTSGATIGSILSYNGATWAANSAVSISSSGIISATEFKGDVTAVRLLRGGETCSSAADHGKMVFGEEAVIHVCTPLYGWRTIAHLNGGAPPEIGWSGGYFVLVPNASNANMGGLAGATSLCVNALSSGGVWRGKTDATQRGIINSSQVRPFLCTTGGCQNGQPNTTYRFAVVGASTAGGATFTTDGSGVGPGDTANWGDLARFGATEDGYYIVTGRNTGSNSAWATTAHTNTCGDWTVTSGNARYGITFSTGTGRWSQTSMGCNTTWSLACFVDP